MKSELAELKGKVRELQMMATDRVPLYEGAPLLINPTDLNYISSENREGAIVRNLMRVFFTEEEMKGHSRTGKKYVFVFVFVYFGLMRLHIIILRCSANLRKNEIILPQLDSVKMDTIMGKHARVS